MDLGVAFAFVSFSFWTRGIWDNPLSNGLCLARGTCSTDVCLDLTPCLSLNLSNCLLGSNPFWGYMFYFYFLALEV
jgi:hypothetical protein